MLNSVERAGFQIIKAHLQSNLTVGFVSAVPYAIASVAMLIWAGIVDRNGKRVGNLGLTCEVSTLGLSLAVVANPFWPSFNWLTRALFGITAARAIFWTIPARFLTGAAAAAGLAFINSVGTLGGFVSPGVVGWLKETTGSFSAGLIGLAGLLLLLRI